MGLLANKVALVTGAGMGIGRAIAVACAQEGASVVIADFNQEAGTETVDIIIGQGGIASFVLCDVSDEELVAAMVQHTLDTYGQLDVACNSAAVTRGSGPIHKYQRDDWDRTLEMCLTNTWLCMKHELVPMLAAGAGAIVNISSNASLKGQPHNSAYAAAKGGVNILTSSSAGEYGHKGVRINAVSPGTIRTPGVEAYFAEQPRQQEVLTSRIPMRRLGEPEEIAEAVVFLLSDRASYITGQILSVDGGNAVF
ncbi:SDR family oxidoreductase [Halieaceae bacterium IMCC14734]|uniref:SDR family oxidoreductase n=1 Tax=Candidatus Litorirhabdus singularis TaxID=2518993 RepID=A0ABT3TJ22_9GAMM|nr:SDR family NAD(P)-dependent oxidoreductase [Candidatus Litorirhabdus singularis]MCX2982308.1 SDR family oxidoreductase [Candidatus Litorirhabdus singularis]